MTKKSSSYERAFSIWSNVSNADMLLYNASVQQKDFVKANKILKTINKTDKNLSDNTLKAYSRLSNQYINAIDSPNKQINQILKKKYAIELKKNEFSQNLEKMGNDKKSELKKSFVSSSDILQLSGTLNINKMNHYETKITKKNEFQFLHEITHLAKNKNRLLTDLSISEFRVFVIAKTNLKEEFVVSTKWLKISDKTKLPRLLLLDLNKYINSTSLYYDFHGENADIEEISSYIIEYR